MVWGWRSMVLKRKENRATRPTAPASSGTEFKETPAAVKDELRLLAREITDQLDSRAANLERLIALADERIQTLRQGIDGERLKATHLEKPLDHGAERNDAARVESAHEHPLDSSHRMVFELADAGVQPVDIARRVGKPTGQVELILSLRRAARGKIANRSVPE